MKDKKKMCLWNNGGIKIHTQLLKASRNRDEDGQSESCLEEACKHRDITLIDALLKHGARDDSAKALKIAIQNKDDILMAKLLAIRVSQFLCALKAK